MKKSKTKKKASRKTSISKRADKAHVKEYVKQTILLPQGAADYLHEISDIAEMGISSVMTVLAATAIYQARRVPIHELNQLRRCREVMEANDPVNFRNIFGPPPEDVPPPTGDAAAAAPPSGSPPTP